MARESLTEFFIDAISAAVATVRDIITPDPPVEGQSNDQGATGTGEEGGSDERDITVEIKKKFLEKE